MKSDEKVLAEIGAKLKKLRIEAGYTSYENFAIQYDLSRMQYWRMENGKVNMTIKSLKEVLDIHKVSLEEFFTGGDSGKLPKRKRIS